MTQNGTLGRITVPGEGAFFFDVGKYIIDFEEDLVFLAGSHHRGLRQVVNCSPDFPLGVELEVFVRGEDAERVIREVRGDDPDLARYLRIEERELEAGGLNRIETSKASAGDDLYGRGPPGLPRP